ncbi:MAG: helix-turn-helix domain-containing protein [Leptotrichiaceae bacterium]|nr:helix-turn-helix domain-containing protein [Leptotrichiaceae bacterium]
MDKLFHPEIENIVLEQIFYALSDSTRLTIFKRLYGAEKEGKCGCFEDLGKKNNLSHHFKVLRENGIIKVRIDGRNRYISIRKDELNSKFPNLLDLIYSSCKK